MEERNRLINMISMKDIITTTHVKTKFAVLDKIPINNNY